MIKNAFIYRLLTQLDRDDIAPLQDALSADEFAPCAPSQDKSVGWVPPRGHKHGLMLEAVGGQWILKLMTETKVVPAAVIKRALAERVDEIEAQTGRKLGKKETREIAEDVRLALLPMAFTKQVATLVWIDPVSSLLVVDASTQTRADEVVTMLIKAIDGLTLQMINTTFAPAGSMASWLINKEAPSGFSVDRECELKACDETKSVVRYGRHALDTDEVGGHIRMGKMPTRLALTFDDRVSFVLTEGLKLRKIAFLDVVFEQTRDGDEDHFDADVAIATGELSNLLPALFGALGGEVAA